jgi:protein-S-isoprenylcysteine O-methyltransferase Ste14
MTGIANIIVSIAWVVMILYWLISAFSAKKNILRSKSWAKSFWVRILFVVAVVWVFQVSGLWESMKGSGAYPGGAGLVPGVAWLVPLGAALTLAGIAFAIWARVHLGRNWSGVPSIKKDHELVTSGPYRFVRHPIYTGIIAALLGTAFVDGLPWLVAFVIFGIVFVMRIPVEEKFMMQFFPDQYPEYRKRTKALVPFVY